MVLQCSVSANKPQIMRFLVDWKIEVTQRQEKEEGKGLVGIEEHENNDDSQARQEKKEERLWS